MLSCTLVGLLLSALLSTIIAASVPKAKGSAEVVAYYGQTGGQDRLKNFCDDDTIDIFPVGFVIGFPNDPGNNGFPMTNFGNQCGGYWNGTKTFGSCFQLIEDIEYCQAKGKKILISLGGDSHAKLISDEDGSNFAHQLWQIFGPKPCGWTGPRPFGDLVVDGFDLDIERNGDTGVPALARTLRSLMDSDMSKNYLLTAAPQCLLPDAQLGTALASTRFDRVWVQFYDTPQCAANNPAGFNFKDWVNWVQTNSPKPPPQLLVGLPANPSEFYLSPEQVKTLIEPIVDLPLFGGVMMWDATYSAQNVIDNATYAGNMHKLLAGYGYSREVAVPRAKYPYNCSTMPPAVNLSADIPTTTAAATSRIITTLTTSRSMMNFTISQISTSITSTQSIISISNTTSTSSKSMIPGAKVGCPR